MSPQSEKWRGHWPPSQFRCLWVCRCSYIKCPHLMALMSIQKIFKWTEEMHCGKTQIPPKWHPTLLFPEFLYSYVAFLWNKYSSFWERSCKWTCLNDISCINVSWKQFVKFKKMLYNKCNFVCSFFQLSWEFPGALDLTEILYTMKVVDYYVILRLILF